MKYFIAALTVMVIVSHAYAGEHYLPDVKGQIYILDGSVDILGKSTPSKKIIKVMDNYTDTESGEVWIVHDITISGLKSESVFRYYAIRSDGVYCMAECASLDKKPDRLKEPYLVFPLPPENGKSWNINISGKAELNMTYTIEDFESSIILGDKTFHCVKVTGVGVASVLGMKIPVTQEKYFHSAHGVIMDTLIQKFSEKNEAKHEFRLSSVDLEKKEL
ncbi:hypothetical protein JW979_00645 [bacterium]|nr:hypothetical protein [candidate division CSSED10-310 bacterium]